MAAALADSLVIIGQLETPLLSERGAPAEVLLALPSEANPITKGCP
jgi:hypothetical protein